MAFKGSPSSQHQHCTDEAQKAENSTVVGFLAKFQRVRFAFYLHRLSWQVQLWRRLKTLKFKMHKKIDFGAKKWNNKFSKKLMMASRRRIL